MPKAPFSSTNERFKGQKQTRVSTSPGPGAYKSKGLKEQIDKKVWGKQGPFGTVEKRFAHLSHAVEIFLLNN
jgi:hypothetical protein